MDFARERGARAIEGYPMTTKNAILEELHVGTEASFADAGFIEVSRPTLRRVVMRVDFELRSAVAPRSIGPFPDEDSRTRHAQLLPSDECGRLLRCPAGSRSGRNPKASAAEPQVPAWSTERA